MQNEWFNGMISLHPYSVQRDANDENFWNGHNKGKPRQTPEEVEEVLRQQREQHEK